MAEDNLTVSDGIVVSMDYTLRVDDDSEIADTSAGREPLQFVQGQGQIVAGLEQELYGMRVGQEKDVVVTPGEGYGESDPEAYQVVPLDAFPPDMTIEPGMGLQLRDPSGNTFEAYVADVSPEGVTIDFNHPLAGKTLHFSVRIAHLREATEAELAHGHAHSAGEEEDED